MKHIKSGAIMSEKILMRNCQTCKNYKIGIDGICKDCTLHRAQPNYSNWEWNGIEDGCEFCNGDDAIKIGYIEISTFEIREEKHLNVIVYDDECGLEVVDEESFPAKYCMNCGRRLVNTND